MTKPYHGPADAAPDLPTSYDKCWEVLDGTPGRIQNVHTGEIRELRPGDVLPDGTHWTPPPPTVADEWNAANPVGTLVKVWPALRAHELPYLSATRSAAWQLPSGDPVVLVEGRAGGFHLGYVEPLSADLAEAIRQGVTWDQFATEEWDGAPVFAGDLRGMYDQQTLPALPDTAEFETHLDDLRSRVTGLSQAPSRASMLIADTVRALRADPELAAALLGDTVRAVADAARAQQLAEQWRQQEARRAAYRRAASETETEFRQGDRGALVYRVAPPSEPDFPQGCVQQPVWRLRIRRYDLEAREGTGWAGGRVLFGYDSHDRAQVERAADRWVRLGDVGGSQ